MPAECMGIPGERMGRVQCARGMQGNSRETYGTRCKVTGECRGMQRNAGNARGTRQWVQSARGMQGNARGT